MKINDVCKGMQRMQRDAKGCKEMQRDAKGCKGMQRDAKGCKGMQRDVKGRLEGLKRLKGLIGSKGLACLIWEYVRQEKQKQQNIKASGACCWRLKRLN